jgi:hypothetical protein
MRLSGFSVIWSRGASARARLIETLLRRDARMVRSVLSAACVLLLCAWSDASAQVGSPQSCEARAQGLQAFAEKLNATNKTLTEDLESCRRSPGREQNAAMLRSLGTAIEDSFQRIERTLERLGPDAAR